MFCPEPVSRGILRVVDNFLSYYIKLIFEFEIEFTFYINDETGLGLNDGFR